MASKSKRKASTSKQAVAAIETPAPIAVALPRWILPLFVTIYVALTLLIIVRVPLNSAPDEANHFEYVEYIATKHALPRFFDYGGNKLPGYEFHQPPLYYAICSLWWHGGDETGQRYVCRVFSMLCGVGVLVLLWFATRELLPERPEISLLATGLAALWPLHQYVGAAAGNDSMAGLFSAALFYLIARGAMRGWSWQLACCYGVVAGLGILAKTTCLLIAIIGLGAILHTAGKSNAVRWLAGGIALALMVVVCGWWLVRNQSLYGDPLVLGAFNRRFEFNPSSTKMLFRYGSTPFLIYNYIRSLVVLTFCTMWGVFGGPNRAYELLHPFRLDEALGSEAKTGLAPLTFFALATGVALLGLVQWWRVRHDFAPRARIVLAWWAMGLAVVVLSMIQFVAHYFQAQARYLHPALLPMAVFFAIGWEYALVKPSLRNTLSALLALLLIGMTLWNAFGWRTLA